MCFADVFAIPKKLAFGCFEVAIGQKQKLSRHRATAQKLLSACDILILARLLKQKLERKTRRHEEAKSRSKRPCAKAGKT